MRSPFSSPFSSPFRSAFGESGASVILTSGDSWLDYTDAYLAGAIPGATVFNRAVSATGLYTEGGGGTGQTIIERLDDDVTSPLGAYTSIVLQGGINDYYYEVANTAGQVGTPPYAGGAFDLAKWKDSLIERIDLCFNAGFYNVVVMSAPCIQDYMDGTQGSNVWRDMYLLDTTIPQQITDFDDWAEAYCNAVGVKFCNINQAPFADGSYVMLSGLGSAAHPNAAGMRVLAGMLAPYITSAALPRKTSHQVILDRPNRDLLTIADMTRITSVVDGLGDEWSKAYEIWLLDQTDASAAGNALTGIKRNTVMLPRSGAAGTTVQTVTHDSTVGALGVALTANEYLRTTIAPSAIGKTMSMGVVFQARGSFSTWVVAGVEQTFGSHIFELSFLNDTDIRSKGLTTSWATSTTNPSTLMGKLIEVRMVESGANQINTLYESGVSTATATTTYSGTLPTQEITVNGVNLGGSFPASSASTTIGAFFLSDGTGTPSLWTSVLE